ALFVLSMAVIWFFGGRLVDSTDRMAHRLHKSGFRVAFFVLGFITSISELSVMVSASLDKAPQISAGNLVGASIVIFLLIIPFLAIRSHGIKLAHTLTKWQLLVALIAVFLPAALMADGVATINEGIVCLLVYVLLVFLMHPRFHASVPLQPPVAVGEPVGPLDRFLVGAKDVFGILVGGVIIFFASRVLIDETRFLSELLRIPGSFIGLLILSIGTNIPELVVAIRAVQKKHTDIALGNYLGSAITNTVLFGVLVLFNGRFTVDAVEFSITSIVTGIGLIAFYWFARSKNLLSRMEGWVLAAMYIVFVLFQIYAVAG
ncbi:MAG: cation:H+ antiporter, partial [Patescibacteria group bacterium]|nr:cation:H+ antiporter [Patescibacteria group bacterium]